MRRALTLLVGVAIGLLVGNSVIGAAPALDGRWQTAGLAHDTSIVDRLTRSDKAPLLFVPDSVTSQPVAPVTLVIVLPGLGSFGRDLAQEFVPAAEEHRWLLLAPSPDYDPIANETLTLADLRVDESLVALADQVMAQSRFRIAPTIDVIGFSRGAQSAHRFALRHPESVAALATFSAGTYTMPNSSQPYPFGLGDFALWNHQNPFDLTALRHVRVFVGVGGADANPADVVRDWDAVGGTTRLERGARFAQALQQLGIPSRFASYPGVGHAFVPAMHADTVGWFLGGS
jgi:pimeloyl-ACP methyl ester carboxylesterase